MRSIRHAARVLSFLALMLLVEEVDAAPAPNVILVMTDDQGYGDLACHGNPYIQTPHLDRLHSQSVRLTDYHVDPTCAPTRASLMTGRYSSKTGVWHTIMGRSLLAEEETTMAEVFAANGYATGIFGKWHLGDNYPLRPQDRGFQQVLVHGGGGVTQTPDFWGNNYFDDTYLENGKPRQFTGYCTDVFFDNALQFIDSNKNKPFFLYLPTNAPHSPYLVDERYNKPYADQGVPSPRDKFWGMITNLDDNMGRLAQHLDNLGLADNTILIFTTDNGTAAGHGRGKSFNAGMRGAKGSEYDGGHRVPCFWRWPGKLQQPKDITTLAAHIDVLPTLIDLCDLKVPETRPMDGISLAPVLREGKSLPARTITVHSQRIDHPEKWRQCAVMTQKWRLVNGRELYDIISDPGQQTDVAQHHPETLQQLRGEYERWYSDISERFDDYVRPILGAAEAPRTELTAHDWHAPQELIPWNQTLVAKSDFWGNGIWKVRVAREGTYRFTLRQRPEVARFPIEGSRYRVRIGDQLAEGMIDDNSMSISTLLRLVPGDYDLQTWFTATQAKERGAYFVEVEYLEDGGKD